MAALCAGLPVKSYNTTTGFEHTTYAIKPEHLARKGEKKGKGGEGKGAEGWEEKFRGLGGRRKRGRKRGGDGKFRGAAPPQYFFLELRLADHSHNSCKRRTKLVETEAY